MGIVKIDQIEPGMVLAAEVRDHAGRVLLGAGAQIAEKHLSIFRRFGVIQLDIEGHGDPVTEDIPIDPEVLEEARVLARERFRFNDVSHPFLEILMEKVALRLARSMMMERVG